MLIISDYRDFYDNSIGYGVDKSVIYMRRQNKVNLTYDSPLYKKIKSLLGEEMNKTYHVKHGNGTVRPFFIGFCGKIYKGYNFMPYSRHIDRSNNQFGFDASSFSEEQLNSSLRESFNFMKGGDTLFKDLLKKESFIKENIDFFHDKNMVSFYFEDNSQSLFIENPILAEFNFQKVMDSTTAFQEIGMFISGVLGRPEKEIIEITDKDRIISHGFDSKSFRKESNKA